MSRQNGGSHFGTKEEKYSSRSEGVIRTARNTRSRPATTRPQRFEVERPFVVLWLAHFSCFSLTYTWSGRSGTAQGHFTHEINFLWKVLNMIEGVMKKYLVEVMKYTFRLIHIQQIWQTSICYDRRFCDNFSIFAL